MKILCIGEEWRGSDSSSLFYSLNRNGCTIDIVNELRYISTSGHGIKAKLFNKFIRKTQIIDFNNLLKIRFQIFNPDIVFIYKGAYLMPNTLKYFKSFGCKIVNFFPDTSFYNHTNLLPQTIQFYDWIFTTKSFGINDLLTKFNFVNSSFMPHAFDPLVHKKLQLSEIIDDFKCDVSFIGTYSPKKEKTLSYLATKLSESIIFKIWGTGWSKCKSTNLYKHIQGYPVYGDLYSQAINASSINIALLVEKQRGGSQGDLITSRTFHIPAAGGFMLHERNEEVLSYFKEGKEADYFSNETELCDKVSYYLNNVELRLKNSQSGYIKAQEFHSIDKRVEEILKILNKL